MTDLVKAYASQLQFERFSENDVPSAFSDTIWAAEALQVREENFDSAANALAAGHEKKAKQIIELGGNSVLTKMWGDMDPAVRASLRASELRDELDKNPHWRAFAPYAKRAYEHVRAFERQYPEIPDDEQIMADFAKESAKLRKAEQFILQRGSGVAAFLGTAAGVFQDPLVLASLPLGASGAAGRTTLGTIGRVAAIEGSVAVGIEIPIQAEVFRFKREIESPWSFKQSAVNVLAAGAGAVVLAGSITGGILGIKRALDSYRVARDAGQITPSKVLDDADQILEDTLGLHDENPLESPLRAEGEPEPPAPVNPHERAFEDARVQHTDNRPVDVRNDVEFLEPADGMHQVLTRSEDPGELVSIDPREVQIDAETFQFKSGSDGAGVNDTLRDVTKFDQRLAGVSLIWERADGTQFIADGHQRAALGVRAIAAGQDPAEVRLNGFILREADGVTAIDARRMAAVKNMAEGSGSALDAAKILRAVGPMGEAMLPPLPPRSALVRQARGLARLGEDEFLQVVNGVIDERFGAIVGAATVDSKLQQAMISVLRRTKPANETQARSIVDQVREAGTETTITEDLFGAKQVTESLYLERAQVLDAALKEARKDRAVFGRLLSEEGRITETGQNRLDTAANFERLQEASNATTQISRLANTKGPISEALTEAARAVKKGKKPGDVTEAFLATTRREILAGDRGGRTARGTRPGSDPPGAQGRIELKKGVPVRLTELLPNERGAAQVRMLERQADLSIAQLYAKAEGNQKLLAREAQKIIDELGEDVVLSDPGIKKRSLAEAKLKRKGYASAGEMTDIVRLGFLVRTPELAAKIIDRLAEMFEVLDEGITVTGMGYVDHKALVRFSDGRVGEIQLWDPQMRAAKSAGGGDLYRSVRTISAEDLAKDAVLAAQVRAAEQASKELFATALAKASPEWRRSAMMILPEDMRTRVQAAVAAGGSTGEPGNISKNAFRDISEPDSKISTGEARDQDVSPEATKKPSVPPGGVSRTTAGLASQLKNRSAIDAAPRQIVRSVDDTRTPAPDATRTGTVPDIEYDAVMAKVNDLIDNSGELARVSREVNGELETRSLASELESLDALEDTLERIRICTFAPRSAA